MVSVFFEIFLLKLYFSTKNHAPKKHDTKSIVKYDTKNEVLKYLAIPEKQANVYKQLLIICLEEENCENFQFWDFVDGHTAWTPVSAPQNPYLLAKNYSACKNNFNRQ